jgi:hypothetical protein
VSVEAFMPQINVAFVVVKLGDQVLRLWLGRHGYCCTTVQGNFHGSLEAAFGQKVVCAHISWHAGE